VSRVSAIHVRSPTRWPASVPRLLPRARTWLVPSAPPAALAAQVRCNPCVRVQQVQRDESDRCKSMPLHLCGSRSHELETQSGTVLPLAPADRGGEFMCGALEEWYAEKGIVVQPRTPQMNGLAGAQISSATEAQPMLSDARMPAHRWNGIHLCANDLHKLVPCRGCSHCHHAAMFGAQPDISICRGVRCRRLRTHPAKADRQAERPRSSWPACGLRPPPMGSRFPHTSCWTQVSLETCVTFDEAQPMTAAQIAAQLSADQAAASTDVAGPSGGTSSPSQHPAHCSDGGVTDLQSSWPP
jgi:hypothetical protein